VITDVAGVAAGHWTDPVARTGCTVVLFPPGTVASGEVRGGAPGSREWALLEPGRTVTTVDAVVLTGGSAFGLAACDGVAGWLEERGRGLPTPAGPVPIVVGLVLFDLLVGSAAVRPDASAGRAACEAAVTGPVPTGAVGAGTGATIGKWRGPAAALPGGIGTATERDGGLEVAALVAVNALGSLRPADGYPVPLTPWPGTPAAHGDFPGPGDAPPSGEGLHTTIGVVATNATLDKSHCRRVADAGHDGLARVLEPVHSTMDGDALVAAATAQVEAGVDQVAALAARAVERAVRQGVAAGAAP
jgi:L-aminopeptidase/D-esterase-like protein